jgi:hypothetical protein
MLSPLGPHRPGEVLVKLKPQFRLESDLCADYQMDLLETVPLGHSSAAFSGQVPAEFLHLKLPVGVSTEQALLDLSQDSRVEYAAPNSLYEMDARPNDPLKLYGMDKIQAPQAWDITTGSRTGPVVAVLDCGVDYTHPDLAPNMWTNPAEVPGNGVDDDGNGVVDDIHGFDAARGTGDSVPVEEHGTHCAGTIGAVGNNALGVNGVNWQARMMGINIFNGFGASAVSIAKALHYAGQMGASIASCSFGGGVFNPAVYEAFRNSPMLHICAAGNNAKNSEQAPHYPASFDLPNIVSVAATDDRDQLGKFSNFGNISVDLAAPGVAILSTVPGGGYQELSGTSMATPMVSGVAALVASAFPQATPDEIRTRLLGGVDPIAGLAGKVVTGGRLNALKALENDTLAPGPITRLTAQAPGPGRVVLNWRAGGDDGDQGKASAYQLRVAQQPIADEAEFARAQSVPVAPPQAAGTKETALIPVLPAAQPRLLYCALRALDNVGNLGAVAQTRVEVPAARLALEAPAGSQTDWTGQGSWQVSQLPGIGPVWTDSPDAEYANKQDASLTSKPFSLQDMRSSKLYFQSQYSIEREKDALKIELSPDGGKNWKLVKSLDGDSPWKIHELDLSAFDGQRSLQLRFRLQTDSTGQRDGFYLGQTVIAAG